MEWLGAAGAGVAVALENLFPPLPSEVVLPLAGFAAHRGMFSLGEAIIWTTAGSVIGALALYGLGAVVGRDRLVDVVSKIPLVDAEDIVRAERWFERWGPLAVLFGRMIPIVRSLISVPAGVARMPLPRFVVYTAVGSVVWNSLFICAGYLLGAQWPLIESYAGAYTRLALTFAIVVAGFLVLRRVATVRRSATGRSRRP
ncbi:MAG: DedA family protein [Actinobacteria bacterium]|jgi:membrane protein DedA with SNARE-associated domain|nr:DedA family protein [Actinomycetota bacterium]